jgi:hypothetical protein
MDSYIDKNGNKQEFTDPEVVTRIKSKNNMLKKMYDFIERNLSEVRVIEPIGFSADEKHKWGFMPFHYEISYYKFFIETLNSITKPQRALI